MFPNCPSRSTWCPHPIPCLRGYFSPALALILVWVVLWGSLLLELFPNYCLVLLEQCAGCYRLRRVLGCWSPLSWAAWANPKDEGYWRYSKTKCYFDREELITAENRKVNIIERFQNGFVLCCKRISSWTVLLKLVLWNFFKELTSQIRLAITKDLVI